MPNPLPLAPSSIPLPRPDPRVPLPQPDPRQAMMQGLMGKVPLPKKDPRDWINRAIAPQTDYQAEMNSGGSIQPSTMLGLRGYNTNGNLGDANIYGPQGGMDQIQQYNLNGVQRPIGQPVAQPHEQDAGLMAKLLAG